MRIDWRASARRQELLVKNFEEMEKPSLRFSWEQTENIVSAEDRISQLCLWVDLADRQGHAYSLELGPHATGMDRGPAHRKACLKILAMISVAELS